MLEGIERAGDKVTGETIKGGLETVKDYDTGGITAPITWTKEDHAGNKHVKLYEVRDRRWVALTDFVKVER
jgi:branched-chain amino acid transport system substrate-binding protein